LLNGKLDSLSIITPTKMDYRYRILTFVVSLVKVLNRLNDTDLSRDVNCFY